MMPRPEVSVVVCTRNRAAKLARALEALDRRSIGERAEVVVVDDGSTDLTAEVARSHPVRLVPNRGTQGLGSARNLGVAHAAAPVVAFTDDDCVPEPDWLERLLPAFSDPGVVAAGGRVEPLRVQSFNHRYLDANNPLAPLEADLAESDAISYRLLLYLKRNLSFRPQGPARDVYAMPGANLAVRKPALEATGGFDAGIRFGGEDEDFCHRLRATFPACRLRYVPEALVRHDYDPRLSDTLRRSYRYGRGNLRNRSKHPHLPPTVFPVPLLAGGLLLAGVRRPAALAAGAALPLLASPRWSRLALARRSAEPLLYAYVQALQEAAHDAGYAAGLLALLAARGPA